MRLRDRLRRVGALRRASPLELTETGLTALGEGSPEEALVWFELALSACREAGEGEGVAASLHNIGLAHSSSGRTSEAVAALREALTVARGLPGRAAEREVLLTLAQLRASPAAAEAALEACSALLTMARAEHDRPAEGGALGMLAGHYLALGQDDRAIAAFAEALDVFHDLGDRQTEAATLMNLGFALGGAGRLEDAEKRLTAALELFGRLGDAHGQAQALVDLGLVDQEQGRGKRALRRFEEARASVDDRGFEGAIANNVGIVLSEQLGRHDDARRSFEEALAVDRELRDAESEAGTLANLGVVCRRLGRTGDAIRHYEQATAIAERLRGEVGSAELRTSYLAKLAKLYAGYVGALVDEGQRERALEVAERGRAQTFLALLAEAQADVRKGADPALREQEQLLLSHLRETRRVLVDLRAAPAAARKHAQIAAAERRERELELDLHANEAEIRRRNPRYAALTQPQAWGLGQIQTELLGKRTALLEYVLGEESSLLFVVLRDDFEVFVLPPAAEIEPLVRELRAAIGLGLHRYPHGYELYRLLIAPAAELLRGKQLLIVADGALHYLPFGLLLTEPPERGGGAHRGPGGERRSAGAADERELEARLERELAALPGYDWQRLPYLVRTHAVGYTSSATVAGLLRQDAARHPPGPFAGALAAFADPLTEDLDEDGERGVALDVALEHTRGTLARIPRTAQEAWDVAELVCAEAAGQRGAQSFDDEHVRLRTGRAATKEDMLRLTSGDTGYRFLHIATHGLLDAEKPQFSGLLFSPESGGDRYWHTFEIFNARIPSELVCLSACETGLGRLVRGEGIVGLTRAFLYAGAQCVCVSLWKVADPSSPELMRTFYERLLAGDDTATALQQAQLAQIDSGIYAHPFYWAPFVLVGERR